MDLENITIQMEPAMKAISTRTKKMALAQKFTKMEKSMKEIFRIIIKPTENIHFKIRVYMMVK